MKKIEPIMQDELKPVAWMYQCGKSHIVKENRDLGLSGYTETPLYAHPPTTNPVDDRETPVGDHQMVEAVDREAAWPYRPSCYKVDDYTDWMAGKYDLSAAIIKGFTRHRQAALTAARAQVEGESQRLREALEQCRAQFAFYADEHRKADKSEKAATNERFAQIARQALAAGEHRKDAP